MNLVDVTIAVAVIGVGALGWYDGFVRAAWALVGVLVGTAVGLVVVPLVFAPLPLSWWVGMLAIGALGGCAALGRVLAVAGEARLRERTQFRPIPWVDRPLGAALGAVTALGFGWMVGMAVAGSVLPELSRDADRSVALRALDSRLPLSHFLAARFARLGDDADFPRYVDVFTAERIVAVPRPPADVVDAPGVQRASRSVWRIVAHEAGPAGKEGSGFLVGRERLLTAAHVVWRTDQVTVDGPDGPLDATVVVCDPDHDIAVLAVPGLTGRVLGFATGESGDPAAVIGFPQNGPLTITPARIREHLDWQSADIEGDGRYEHDAYSVRARVHTGNSGGPLVTPSGRVLGMVVAMSRADADTAYALAGQQVAGSVDEGVAAPADAAVPCG